MATEPKVSIIIPTRCRPDTLKKSLKTAINQCYDNLDIIVCDNFSGDETIDVVRDAGDPRIKYVSTGDRLSMSHNFEFAISKLTEGWIIVIGDDDGLLPNSLGRVVDLLQSSGAQALASRICCYKWPNCCEPATSIISVPMRRGHELRDLRKMMKKLMNGIVNYPELPMLYTGGVVHFDVVDNIRRLRGSFFQSMVPDVFSSIAISSIVDRYVFSYEPFAISGVSKHSTSAAKQGDLSNPAAQFFQEKNIPFHDQVPLDADGYIPCFILPIVYECYLQAMYLHGDPARIQPAHQLQVFLGKCGAKDGAFNDWCRTFAAFHQLDFASAKAKAHAQKARIGMAELIANAANFKDRYRIDSSFNLKINDVYEASQIADTVLKTRPSRLTSYMRTLRRKLC